MKFQYNLNYIGGIDGYNKRAIYTLKITDDYFYVNGLIKSKKFAYEQVKGIFFGEINDLKRAFEEVKLLFEQVSLLDYRLNRKLKYCLVIVLEDTKIVFAQEEDINLKNAFRRLKERHSQKTQSSDQVLNYFF